MFSVRFPAIHPNELSSTNTLATTAPEPLFQRPLRLQS